MRLSRIRTWSIRRLGDERGVALVLALLVMSALTISTGTVLYFTSTSARTSAHTNADAEAYALAEAGINTGIAKIYGAADARLTTVLHAGTAADPATVVPRCSTGVNAAETPTCYATGSVTYSGTLDTAHGNTWYWTIVSIGTVPNPTGGSPVTRRLTRSVGITGSNGTDGNAWTRFYQDSTASCLTLDGVTVPTNFAAKGDVCLVNGSTVTGAHTNINAGGTVYLDPPVTKSPTSATGWTNSTSALAQDAAYATSGNIAGGANSAYLDVTNLGLTIASTATIRGVTVTVRRKGSTDTATKYVYDNDVYLLRSGAAVGTNHAAASTTHWPTLEAPQGYGAANDLWGTTWTPAQVNASTFGVRIRAHSICSSCSNVGSVNSVTVTVAYTANAAIGSAATPIEEVHVGTQCRLNSNAGNAPCGTSDRVWAGTSDVVAPAANETLSMPQIDWQYWWANAKPGPKHFCTNPNPGLPTNFFDNDANTTNGPNQSILINGEMAAAGHPYTCEVWENGVLQGRLKWDGAHRLDIYGTIFVDGNFRFDEDGLVIRYYGRATIMSSRDDEIDAVVCSGGDITKVTYAQSCLVDPGNWDPTQNMMVLMSNMQNEYDQGATTCAGSPPSCYSGHKPAGFQGILYSTADCLIHQNFQDSGPVICNTITLPNEAGVNPTYYPFPSIGKLTDGMSVSDTAHATNLAISVSAQGDG